MKKSLILLSTLLSTHIALAAGGVVNGQPVNATVTNAAFLFKNGNDTDTFKITLSSSDPTSGPSLVDIQKQMNSLSSFLGMAINQVYNYLPAWATNNLGVSTNTVFARVEAIDAAFNGTSGHNHNGTAGNGPLIALSGSTTGTLPVSHGGTNTDFSASSGAFYLSGGVFFAGLLPDADLAVPYIRADGARSWTGNQSLAAENLTSSVVNSSTTGTTVNKIAKMSGLGAVVATTSDVNGLLGIVSSGAGTTGNAELAAIGQPLCVFDGSTTLGDYVVSSTTTGGDCHDAGSTSPSGVQVIGRVLSSNLGAGTFSVLVTGGGGGGSLSTPISFANGGTNAGTQAGAQANMSTQTTKGDTQQYSTLPVRHAVPGDYGHLLADAAQADGWRSATYLTKQTNGASRDYVQYGDFENDATTGWTLVGCGTVTNGLPACVSSGGHVLDTTHGTTTPGTHTSAISLDTGSNLGGQYSLNLATSGGAGTIGDGYVSQSIPIDAEDQGAVFAYRFRFQVASGAAVTGGTKLDTYAVAIYSPADNSFLGVSNPFCVTKPTGKGTCTGLVQTLSTTTAVQYFVYSPVAPVASTSSFLTDDFHFTTTILATGYAGSDPISYTPTFVGMGTVTTPVCSWSRSGHFLYETCSFTTGTVTGATATLSLPSGAAIDTTNAGSSNMIVGYGVRDATTATSLGVLLVPTNTGTVSFSQIGSGSTDPISAQIGTVLFGNSNYVSVSFKLPITGWLSNTTMDSSVRNAPNVVGPFLSGSSVTYAPSPGVKYVEIEAVGAGGGGGGSGTTSGTAAGAGTATTLVCNGVTVVSAGGGGAGARGANPVAGGTAAVTSPAIDNGSVNGSLGGSDAGNQGSTITAASPILPGGFGGSSTLGGGGPGGSANGAIVGTDALANTGGGGGGAGVGQVNNAQTGAGGGAGATVRAILVAPPASCTYTIGAGGAGQLAGTSGSHGGAGAAGRILFREFFLNAGTVASAGTVGASCSTTAADGFVTNTVVNFATCAYDNTGSVTTGAAWKFTAPLPGRYQTCADIGLTGIAAGTAAEQVGMQLLKNGSEVRFMGLRVIGTTTSIATATEGCSTLSLVAGDTLAIAGYNNTGARNLNGAADQVYIDITRVGN